MYLWLDDVRPKPERFDVCAATAQAAIAILATGRVRHISFDHDLGEDANGTGYDVACWIEQNAHDGGLPPLTWEIHSANPVGRQRIASAMRAAERFWRNA